ncbi:MAG: hypothetical protein IPF83_12120 [Rhodanobacteraceae bacterium]|nr:hypothetical protein [Rhodanobacteraceae bacterium]
MNDQQAFTKLVEALSPWRPQLVFVGGWAYRLYRLHPNAQALPYQPVATLDADVAFSERERLDGSIKARLIEAGFEQQLTGNHQPPVSKYSLSEDGPAGFYAEFLTPLTGSGLTRDGVPIATLRMAGITAQRLRYLELLLRLPWRVTLGVSWGAGSPQELRIPNPVSFIVQKLLIHDGRPRAKQAHDLLYIHDTLELFAEKLDDLAVLWRNDLRETLHAKWLDDLPRTRERVFGNLTDALRDAAQIPQDRELDPERMRAMCFAALREMLA